MDIFNDGPGTRSAWFGYGGPTSNHLELSNEISGGDFILSTNSTERLRVTTTGNVGIGTPSPGKKLDIVGGDVSIDGTVLNTAGGSDFYITGPASGNIILQPNSSSNAGLAKIGTDGVHYFKKSDGTTNQVIFNNGNVGIGTNSPGTALDVNGSTRATDFQVSQSAFNNGSIELSRAQPFIDFHFNGSAADYTSRIIEGTSGWLTVQANFEVQGNLTPIANNTYDIGNSSQRWRTIYSNNALNTSDRRVKEFIVPLEYGLNEVMRLQPVSFKWKGATDNGKRKLGFIAQDVLPVLSDVVDVPINPNDYLSIAYTDIIPVLVKSIQEQQALIAELKTELTEIKKLLKKNSSNQTASTAQPGKK